MGWKVSVSEPMVAILNKIYSIAFDQLLLSNCFCPIALIKARQRKCVSIQLRLNSTQEINPEDLSSTARSQPKSASPLSKEALEL